MISQRETYILVADNNALFPANFIYPSDDLFPRDARLKEVSNIVAGSLHLDEILAESPIQFGQMYSTKFECQVYLEEDLSGKFIHVYQQNDGIYTDIFAGKIDSCKLDKVGTDRKIVAYDLAYEVGKTNVAVWWNQFWSNRSTATLKQARDSMLNYVGLSFEDVHIPNDNLVIKKDVELTSCDFTTMLRMMCEISYCFPHLDRDGYMRFLFLDTDAEAIDISNDFEWMNSEFEDYATDEIVGVQFYDSDGELKYTVGNTENAYPIQKNIFLYTADTNTLNTIGNDILDYLSTLRYTPADVKMIVGNFSLELGNKLHTRQGDFYILENIYSGSQFIEQNVKSPGEKLMYGGTPTFSYGEIVLNQKIARVKYSVEELSTEFGEYKTDMDGTVTSLSSRITQNAESISTEVTRAEGVENTLSSRITQTADSITSEVTRAKGAESSLSSRITQTAEDITSEVTRATTAEGSLSSRITQNANSISSEVTRAKDAEGSLSSRITQTADAITSEVSRATTAEGNLDSKITQTAESISLDVSNGTTSSTIKLKLGTTELSSKTIQMTGLVKFTDLSGTGTTTINGSNITTGTIDANTVNITNINADNITTGTISANKIKGGQLTIASATDYAQAIVVKVGNSDYIVINANDGIVVGKGYGTYKTSITQNGLTVGNSSFTMVSIKGDNQNGAITVGNNSSNQTVINNGQVNIHNSSWNDGALKVTNSYSGPCIVISANSDTSNAIEVSRGTSSLNALSCTSFKLSNKSYSSGEISMLTSSSSSYSPAFSEIQDVELEDTSLWAVDSYSAPSMKGNFTDGYSFSSSPTWKKISLKKSSYSTKVYGITGGSSIATPQFTTKTVLVQN